MMCGLRLAALLGRLGLEVLRGLWRMRSFHRMSAAARRDAVRGWSRRVLRAGRASLQVHGQAFQGACLVAANHVSWLDIVALNAAHPTRFVAKADVHRWPLLGRLVAGAGTLFIERERPRDALRVVHDIAACLRNAEQVTLFPEGTTSDGTHILPLHANLFQAAISAGAVVQPVLLRYVDAASGAPSRSAAYVGDDTLLDSLRRVAAGPRLRVHVHYLPVLRADDRRELARSTHDALRDALQRAGAAA